MKYLTGQFGSSDQWCALPLLAHPQSIPCGDKSEREGFDAVQQRPKHQCAISTILVTNLKHSTIPTAVKKIIPARLGPQDTSEETQPEVDGKNNIMYLRTHPTAFYFTTEEIPDT